MTKIEIEMSESDLKDLIFKHFQRLLGTVDVEPNDVRIMVKSKQNYKSEWEEAAFKATVTKFVK